MAKPYDNALKALWALGLGSLCRWLDVPVDGDVTPYRLSESLPPAAPERVMDLLATVGAAALLHVEVQAHGEARFEFRNLEYLLRILAHREFAGRQVHQHVLLLGHVTGHLAAVRIPAANHWPGLEGVLDAHPVAVRHRPRRRPQGWS